MSDYRARIEQVNREERARAQARADQFVDTLIEDINNLDVSPADSYAQGKCQHEKFMLAGNGPTVWAHFLWDVDERGHRDGLSLAFITYDDGHKTGFAEIPRWRGQELYRALTGADRPGNVVTWANGEGIWHVRVSRNAGLIAARRALRDELQLRQGAPLNRGVFMHPIEVEDLSTDTTIVYREGDPE